jgi:hypothetical protein
VLSRVGIDDRNALGQIAHQRGRRLLAGERGGDPFDVLGEPDLTLDLDVDGAGQRHRISD